MNQPVKCEFNYKDPKTNTDKHYSGEVKFDDFSPEKLRAGAARWYLTILSEEKLALRARIEELENQVKLSELIASKGFL